MRQEVWAPPFIWGPWVHVGTAVLGSTTKMFREISFDIVSGAPSTFDVEIEYCIGNIPNNRIETIRGVAPATYHVPWGQCAGRLKVRMKSHSIGQVIQVDTK